MVGKPAPTGDSVAAINSWCSGSNLTRYKANELGELDRTQSLLPQPISKEAATITSGCGNAGALVLSKDLAERN
jgi:hypothetical protein